LSADDPTIAPLVNAESQNEKRPAVGQCCGCGSGYNTILPAQDRKVGSFDRLHAQLMEVTAVDRNTFTSTPFHITF
jgi:hypothetical protein